MRSLCARLAAVAAGAVIVCCSGANSHAAVIEPGMYRLFNHPGNPQTPPEWGLRLAELVNVTPGSDQFSFDFEHPLSDVTLEYDGETIRIAGMMYGGLVVDEQYVVNPHLGVYTVDFVYSMGVRLATNDDDLLVDALNHSNMGIVTTPLGETVELEDERSGGYSFRFGDQNDDEGYRGFAGLSGWGWLSRRGFFHTPTSDWSFTATVIPSPGTGASAIVAGVFAMRRRRAESGLRQDY